MEEESKITEKSIFEEFPEIFRDRKKSMKETCMCWGLEVPDSWLPTIRRLAKTMQTVSYTGCSFNKAPQVVAEQVKEKFGSLRFYFRLEWPEGQSPSDEDAHAYYEFIMGMIAFAEVEIDEIEKENQ